MRVLVIFGFMALLLVPALWAERTCSQPDLQLAAQHAKAVQAELLAYKLQGEMDESVPATLQAQISAFKESLAALADAALKCAPDDANPKLIESMLAKLLNANKPVVNEVYDPKKPPQLDHIYGDGITVKVTASAKLPSLFLVEFGFDIACGNDSMLLAYERGNDHWQQALRWQSGNYEDVSGAFGDFFQYQILQPSDSTSWLLAVAHGRPWCTSRWSGFHLDVVQPSARSTPQQTIFDLSADYVRFEIDPTMKLTPGGFQLRMEAGSLDITFMTRPVIYRYRVSGKQFTRIQPIANNGRDFVDEWLQSPWTDAQRWTAPEGLPTLEPVYKKIAALRDPKAKEWPSFTYGPVRSCTDSPSHFQVELDEGWWVEQQKDWRPDKPTFFHIQEGENSFTILSASDKPDPRCTGHDIMPKH
jgi:hypothetical protein